MLRLILLITACSIVLSAPAAAQLSDAFSDGDFTSNPAWTGTPNRWTVAPLDGNPALRSDGAAVSDTIYLATPSAVSRGMWSFTFAHRGINLSNFNGARVFLTADTDTLDGAVFGYYLQLGASNSDEIRLYRQDGEPASSRVLLGQSAEPLLGGDDNTLSITVTRSDAYAWSVSVDAAVVLTTVDSTYTASRYRRTRSRGRPMSRWWMSAIVVKSIGLPERSRKAGEVAASARASALFVASSLLKRPSDCWARYHAVANARI